MTVEEQINDMLRQNLGPEINAKLLAAKATLVLTHRKFHLEGLTEFTREIKILNRNVQELTQQIMYVRGRM